MKTKQTEVKGKKVLLCTRVGEAWVCLFPEGYGPLCNKLERREMGRLM